MGKIFITAACALTLAANIFAGDIIVNNDEWTLSDAGFTNAGGSNAATYAKNAALFLTGVSSGDSIFIDSDNFGLTGNSLKTALGSYTLTDSGTFTAFTAASLAGYNAVFIGGDPLTSAEISALTSYVNGGGSVYIAAGTGDFGTPAAEAATFNPFLNVFGLTLSPSFNGIVASVPVSSTSPVLAGVTQLYYNNGNDVSLFGSNPKAAIITSSGTDGLIGTFSGAAGATPEPSTMMLCGLTLISLGFFRKRVRG